jgi:hypothetical protein
LLTFCRANVYAMITLQVPCGGDERRDAVGKSTPIHGPDNTVSLLADEVDEIHSSARRNDANVLGGNRAGVVLSNSVRLDPTI